jgi:hypothetical protein
MEPKVIRESNGLFEMKKYTGIEEQVLEYLLKVHSGDYSEREIWMSMARAIGYVSSMGKLTIENAIHYGTQFLGDFSTSQLLQELDPVHEDCVGIVPDGNDDDYEYAVFIRQQSDGFMPFFGVYFMADNYIVYAAHRANYLGIFSKSLVLRGITREGENKEIRCKIDRIRVTNSPDEFGKWMGMVALIDAKCQEFPQGHYAYCIPHWWLPMRSWILPDS